MLRPTLALILCLASVTAHADEQTRKLAQFKKITISGAMNLVVDAGKPFSVSVQGEPKFINRVVTQVVNGELRINMNEDKNIFICRQVLWVVHIKKVFGSINRTRRVRNIALNFNSCCK